MKKVNKLTLLLLMFVTLPFSLTLFYSFKSSTADGSLCTFDNFDCPSNNYFFSAIFWGVITVIVGAVAIGVYYLLKRLDSKQKKVTISKTKPHGNV